MEDKQSQVKIGQYLVKDKIGEGSFGKIFLVEKDSQTYAIKTQDITNIKPMLSLQYSLFQKLQLLQVQSKNNLSQYKGYSFPKVYDYREEQAYSYLVMEKLDTTLQDLINVQLQNKIEKDILLVIMYNTFKCIQCLHSIGYVYRDVKPSNFMIKRSQLQQKQAKIYLIDLGLCKQYTKKNSQEHIAFKSNKKMIGTAIFCSLNTHKGFQSSRRDDLQSWIYMIIYLVAKLPWQTIAAQSVPSHLQKQQNASKQCAYDRMGKLKAQTNIVQLIRQNNKLPQCMVSIYNHIKSLEYESKPDYQMIESLMQEEYNKLTGNKVTLKDVHFRVETHIVKQEQKQKTKIKINFKLPVSKRVKQKDLDLVKQAKNVEQN